MITLEAVIAGSRAVSAFTPQGDRQIPKLSRALESWSSLARQLLNLPLKFMSASSSMMILAKPVMNALMWAAVSQLPLLAMMLFWSYVSGAS